MLRRNPRRRARQLTARAASLIRVDRDTAERLYREAVALDPMLPEAWFDLGLLCKWSKRWGDAFEFNLRSAELVGIKRDEPAWWNLGIAATALRRWDVARRAWRAYGIEIPDADGEIDIDFGYGPVRLNPDQHGEVVWGRRIDPARIRIESIPFPQSGHHWGDVVLHDGAPTGYREVNGEQRPVFDELERWNASGVPTIEMSVSGQTSADIDELLRMLDTAGLVAEDWTHNVRALCKRCSEGVIHNEHTEPQLASGHEHFIGVAGLRREVEAVLRSWEQPDRRSCHSLDETP